MRSTAILKGLMWDFDLPLSCKFSVSTERLKQKSSLRLHAIPRTRLQDAMTLGIQSLSENLIGRKNFSFSIRIQNIYHRCLQQSGKKWAYQRLTEPTSFKACPAHKTC